MSFILALLLAQTVSPIKIVDPSAPQNAAGVTNGSLKVTCISGCTGGSGGGSGGGLTDAELRAAPIPVGFDGGYVSILNASIPVTGTFWQATQPVSGTFFQATQPVSGPLTDAQLRAVAVPVSGTVATGGLTDVQLRATAVPVSGTVAVTSAGLTNLDVALSTRTKPSDQQHVIIDSSASIAVTGPVTDAQIRATPLPVSGTVATTNTNIDVALSTRLAETTFTGRFPGAGALSDNFANPTTTQVGAFNLLWDGATWDRAPGTAADGALVNLGANNDVTVTGTVTANAGTGTMAVSLATLPALVAGTANIGDVDVLTLPALTAGNNNIGDVDVASLPSLIAGNANIGDVDVASFPDNEPFNIAQMNGVAVSMGAGNSGTGTQRVVVATDQSALAVTLTSTTVTGSVAVTGPLTDVQLRATPVPVSGTVAATQSGVFTVQPGNTQNTTAWLTTDTPRTVSSANNTGVCVSVTASTTVLASNASRRAYGFKASEDNTAKVHCRLGATATTSHTIFGPGASWSQDTGAVYTGVIDCIAASGTQSVCPYEFH